MTSDGFKILIASLPQRDNVVAEIYHENQQVAEVSMEIPGKFVVEIFPKPDGKLWSFDLPVFQKILQSAASSLSPT